MASSSDELSEQLVDRYKTLDIAIFLTEQAFDAGTGELASYLVARHTGRASCGGESR